MKKLIVGVLMLVGAMWSFKGCTSNQISQKETHIQENLNPNQILEVLQINTFIKKLPNQLETLIGENSLNISGGQKQRLGLARALYSEPEFLLLDEATNALDKQTETIIINSIFSLHSIKNIVIISHNVNNFNYCNKIFKIKNKQLVEMKNE